MSIYSYFVKPPPEFLIRSSLLDPKLEKHFLTYEKYEYFLRSKNFLLLDQPFISKKFPTSGYVRDVIVINKNAFLKMVDQHIDAFKLYLGNKVDGESLLAEIESGKFVQSEVLQENELLFGILLGYGRHNAELYAQREGIFTSLGKKSHDSAENYLTAFSNEYLVDHIPLPLFMCDPQNEETKKLKMMYRKTQKKVCEIFRSSDFLEQVLHQLD